ncbi:MAG: hypothetical protein WC497_04570 [Patescibacteria group bacterium]
MNILDLDRERLLALDPKEVTGNLTPEEVVHIAQELGAYWTYDYGALEEGRPGLHALLKSGLHSDGFFVSRILLAAENIQRIIAGQMARRIEAFASNPRPTCVAGVPDGATILGKHLAEILGLDLIEMQKVDGRIQLVSALRANDVLLLVEDFCTRGTGFTEAVIHIRSLHDQAVFFPCDPVIINRGGLSEITIDDVGTFPILPVVEMRVRDWDPAGTDGCLLCERGSQAIKPKATDQDWIRITTSQK